MYVRVYVHVSEGKYKQKNASALVCWVDPEAQKKKCRVEVVDRFFYPPLSLSLSNFSPLSPVLIRVCLYVCMYA